MTVERTIKELLQIMVDNIELFHQRGCSGLCDLTAALEHREIITHEEMNNLRMYIKLKVPERIVYVMKSAWGWPPYKLQPRLEWLNEQIAKL